MNRPPLQALLGADPIPWLLASEEPGAAWTTLTSIIGAARDEDRVSDSRRTSVGHPAVATLVRDLPGWGEQADVSGHDSPRFLPNMLGLLADVGVEGGDFPHVEAVLDEMLARQDDGRFLSLRKGPKGTKPEWGSLLCDTHSITDVMHRFGRGDDPRVRAAVDRMRADVTETAQGPAWRCVPERRTLFRGPGRKMDVCPIVTLQGLRAFSHLPNDRRPLEILEIARTPLRVWRRRTEERPYQFGHGYQFKSVKWPNIWYDVLYILETVGRYPALWKGPDAREEDARSVAELAACLIAYNFDGDGRVTPRRVHGGFDGFSFGQKKEPSPFATARALAALVRLDALFDDIARTDVAAPASSKGGKGTPVSPESRKKRPLEPACPSPIPRVRRFTQAATIRRAVERQHLLGSSEAASVESVTSDIVGLRVRSGTAPYLSLLARLTGFTRAKLESSLYERHSLVRFRAMRGHLFVVRPSMLQVLFCATSPEILRYSHRNLGIRGVSSADYERLAAEILELTSEAPLSTQEIRMRLGASSDVGAIVTLMCDEGLLLRDRPAGSWRDLRMTYAPLASILPEVRLGGMTRLEASVELVRAYIRGFGPVTAKDVVWWTGVGAKRVEPALAELGDEIARVAVAGSDLEHLLHVADLDELELVHARPGHSVALVPGLDPYTMGYAIRERYVDDDHRRYVMDGAANTAPSILIDGRISGVWDAFEHPEPSIAVQLFADVGFEAMESVQNRAAEVGRFWFGTDVPVLHVAGMQPLSERAIGSFMRPLRGVV